jgi:hypothetical protein
VPTQTICSYSRPPQKWLCRSNHMLPLPAVLPYFR